jgi:hypothetical protein
MVSLTALSTFLLSCGYQRGPCCTAMEAAKLFAGGWMLRNILYTSLLSAATFTELLRNILTTQ